jgi:hypothetical protein
MAGRSITKPSSDYGRWGSGRSAGDSRLHPGSGPGTRPVSRPKESLVPISTRFPNRCRFGALGFWMARVGLGAVLTAGLIGLGSVGGLPSAFADSCGDPVPSGSVRVVMVVDAGEASAGASSMCLVVPSGTTGSQLLARRAAELGMASPRYAGSGLLCAIDGFPATGCGDRTSGGFAYWAYFSGTSGAWNYGSYNPFIRRMADGDIEGWRYVSGTGGAQDPPPRIAPSRSLFPPLALDSGPVSPAGDSGSVPTVAPRPGASGGAIAPADTAVGATDGREAADGTQSVAGASDSIASGLVADDVAIVASSPGGSGVGPWLGVGVAVLLAVVIGLGAFVRTRSRS